MSIAVLNDTRSSQFAKNKELWTLDRKQSVPSRLVWTQKHITRRRENGNVKVRRKHTHSHTHTYLHTFTYIHIHIHNVIL